MQGYYVGDVFPKQQHQYRFVEAVEQYHRETGQPVFLPRQKKKKEDGAAAALLSRLLPEHLELVRAFLPLRVLREARAAYYRNLYHALKLRVVFVGEALSQVRDYDPFLVSMDDVHEADAALTSMTSLMGYYADQF